MAPAIKHLITLLLPLLLTPVFGFLLAEGHLNLGGGEKDLLLLLPWLLWSILFILCGALLRKRPVSYGRWLGTSLAYSFGIIALLWAALLAYSVLTTC